MSVKTAETHSYSGKSAMTDLWAAALLCFVIAGGAGVVFRLMMVHPIALDMVNLRHAHSHLMSFGWLTPALFILMTAKVSGRGAQIFRPIIGTTLVLAGLSFPVFALYGYQPAPVLGKNLALGVMVSTGSILCWYAFAVAWWRHTRTMRRNFSLLLWDLALVFLILSSFGAWGIAAIQSGSMQTANPKMMTHWFLLLFKEGWLILAILGLVFQALELDQITIPRLFALALLVLGLPFSVPLTLGHGFDVFPGSARIGAWLAAAGSLQLLTECSLICIRRKSFVFLMPLGCLVLKSAALMAAALLPLLHLVQHMGTALLYLHLLLLGGVTAALLVTAPKSGIPVRFAPAMNLSVLILLAAMLPFTLFWPSQWFGVWTLRAVLAASVLPVATMALELSCRLRKFVKQSAKPAPAFYPLTH